jgi:hypothetical protein
MMSTTTGTLTDLSDGSISDRALNYAFMKEFLLDEKVSEDWIDWVSSLLGYSESQPVDVLLEAIEKHIKTATIGKKFGL